MDAHMDTHMDAHMDAQMDAHMDAHMTAHMDAHMDAHVVIGVSQKTRRAVTRPDYLWVSQLPLRHTQVPRASQSPTYTHRI